jgi:hypothetical protein
METSRKELKKQEKQMNAGLRLSDLINSVT